MTYRKNNNNQPPRNVTSRTNVNAVDIEELPEEFDSDDDQGN